MKWADSEVAMRIVAQSAPSIGISFADLLRDNESETMKGRAWLEARPSHRLDAVRRSLG